MPRPAIRPLAAELQEMLGKFREEHKDELEKTGPLEVTIQSDSVRILWDPDKVYDDQRPAEERYRL